MADSPGYDPGDCGFDPRCGSDMTPTLKKKPRNGHYFIALLVGGDPRIQSTMATRLAERGVLVVDRWTAAKNLDRRPMPAGVEVVVIFRDSAISRQVRDKIAWNAKTAGAYSVDAQTFAIVDERLDAQGYKARPIEADAPTQTPAPAENPTATETQETTTVLHETDEQKMVRLGAELRRRRDAMGLSANAAGRQIGCSGSYLHAIEKGSPNAKPTDAMLSAIERFFKFPSGAFPRLSTRQNLRMGAPPVTIPPPAPPPAPAPEPVAVVPGPVVDMPLPSEPTVAVPRSAPIDAGIDGKDTNPDFVRLHLEVLAIQGRMRRLGLSRIELTPTSLVVLSEQSDGARSSSAVT